MWIAVSLARCKELPVMMSYAGKRTVPIVWVKMFDHLCYQMTNVMLRIGHEVFVCAGDNSCKYHYSSSSSSNNKNINTCFNG